MVGACSLRVNTSKGALETQYSSFKPLTLNDLYMRRKLCVEVWSNFVHSYSVECCGSRCFSTLEGQAFIQEPECTPSTS